MTSSFLRCRHFVPLLVLLSLPSGFTLKQIPNVQDTKYTDKSIDEVSESKHGTFRTTFGNITPATFDSSYKLSTRTLASASNSVPVTEINELKDKSTTPDYRVLLGSESKRSSQLLKYTAPTVINKEEYTSKFKRQSLTGHNVENQKITGENNESLETAEGHDHNENNIKCTPDSKTKTNTKFLEVNSPELSIYKLNKNPVSSVPEIKTYKLADKGLDNILGKDENLSEAESKSNTQTVKNYIPSVIEKTESTTELKRSLSSMKDIIVAEEHNYSEVDDYKTKTESITNTKLIKNDRPVVSEKAKVVAKLKKRSVSRAPNMKDNTKSKSIAITVGGENSSSEDVEYETKTESKTSNNLIKGNFITVNKKAESTNKLRKRSSSSGLKTIKDNSPTVIKKVQSTILKERSLASVGNNYDVSENKNNTITVEKPDNNFSNIEQKTKTVFENITIAKEITSPKTTVISKTISTIKRRSMPNVSNVFYSKQNTVTTDMQDETSDDVDKTNSLSESSTKVKERTSPNIYEKIENTYTLKRRSLPKETSLSYSKQSTLANEEQEKITEDAGKTETVSKTSINIGESTSPKVIEKIETKSTLKRRSLSKGSGVSYSKQSTVIPKELTKTAEDVGKNKTVSKTSTKEEESTYPKVIKKVETKSTLKKKSVPKESTVSNSKQKIIKIEKQGKSTDNVDTTETPFKTSTKVEEHTFPKVIEKVETKSTLNKRSLSKESTDSYSKQSSVTEGQTTNIVDKTKTVSETSTKVEETTSPKVTEKIETKSNLKRRSLPKKSSVSYSKQSSVTNEEHLKTTKDVGKTKTVSESSTKVEESTSPKVTVKIETKSTLKKRSLSKESSVPYSKQSTLVTEEKTIDDVDESESLYTTTTKVEENTSPKVIKKVETISTLKKRSIPNESSVSYSKESNVATEELTTDDVDITISRTSTEVEESKSPTVTEKIETKSTLKKSSLPKESPISYNKQSTVTTEGQTTNGVDKTKTVSETSTKVEDNTFLKGNEKVETKSTIRKRSLPKKSNVSYNKQRNVATEEQTTGDVVKTKTVTKNSTKVEKSSSPKVTEKMETKSILKKRSLSKESSVSNSKQSTVTTEEQITEDVDKTKTLSETSTNVEESKFPKVTEKIETKSTLKRKWFPKESSISYSKQTTVASEGKTVGFGDKTKTVSETSTKIEEITSPKVSEKIENISTLNKRSMAVESTVSKSNQSTLATEQQATEDVYKTSTNVEETSSPKVTEKIKTKSTLKTRSLPKESTVFYSKQIIETTDDIDKNKTLSETSTKVDKNTFSKVTKRIESKSTLRKRSQPIESTVSYGKQNTLTNENEKQTTDDTKLKSESNTRLEEISSPKVTEKIKTKSTFNRIYLPKESSSFSFSKQRNVKTEDQSKPTVDVDKSKSVSETSTKIEEDATKTLSKTTTRVERSTFPQLTEKIESKSTLVRRSLPKESIISHIKESAVTTEEQTRDDDDASTRTVPKTTTKMDERLTPKVTEKETKSTLKKRSLPKVSSVFHSKQSTITTEQLTSGEGDATKTVSKTTTKVDEGTSPKVIEKIETISTLKRRSLPKETSVFNSKQSTVTTEEQGKTTEVVDKSETVSKRDTKVEEGKSPKVTGKIETKYTLTKRSLPKALNLSYSKQSTVRTEEQTADDDDATKTVPKTTTKVDKRLSPKVTEKIEAKSTLKTRSLPKDSSVSHSKQSTVTTEEQTTDDVHTTKTVSKTTKVEGSTLPQVHETIETKSIQKGISLPKESRFPHSKQSTVRTEDLTSDDVEKTKTVSRTSTKVEESTSPKVTEEMESKSTLKRRYLPMESTASYGKQSTLTTGQLARDDVDTTKTLSKTTTKVKESLSPKATGKIETKSTLNRSSLRKEPSAAYNKQSTVTTKEQGKTTEAVDKSKTIFKSSTKVEESITPKVNEKIENKSTLKMRSEPKESSISHSKQSTIKTGELTGVDVDETKTVSKTITKVKESTPPEITEKIETKSTLKRRSLPKEPSVNNINKSNVTTEEQDKTTEAVDKSKTVSKSSTKVEESTLISPKVNDKIETKSELKRRSLPKELNVSHSKQSRVTTEEQATDDVDETKTVSKTTTKVEESASPKVTEKIQTKSTLKRRFLPKESSVSHTKQSIITTEELNRADVGASKTLSKTTRKVEESVSPKVIDKMESKTTLNKRSLPKESSVSHNKQSTIKTGELTGVDVDVTKTVSKTTTKMEENASPKVTEKIQTTLKGRSLSKESSVSHSKQRTVTAEEQDTEDIDETKILSKSSTNVKGIEISSPKANVKIETKSTLNRRSLPKESIVSYSKHSTLKHEDEDKTAEDFEHETVTSKKTTFKTVNDNLPTVVESVHSSLTLKKRSLSSGGNVGDITENSGSSLSGKEKNNRKDIEYISKSIPRTNEQLLMDTSNLRRRTLSSSNMTKDITKRNHNTVITDEQSEISDNTEYKTITESNAMKMLAQTNSPTVIQSVKSISRLKKKSLPRAPNSIFKSKQNTMTKGRHENNAGGNEYETKSVYKTSEMLVKDNSPTVIEKVESASNLKKRFLPNTTNSKNISEPKMISLSKEDFDYNSDPNEYSTKTKSKISMNSTADKEKSSYMLNKRLLSRIPKTTNMKNTAESRQTDVSVEQQNSVVEGIESKTNSKFGKNNSSLVIQKEEYVTKLKKRSLAKISELKKKIDSSGKHFATLDLGYKDVDDIENNSKTESKTIAHLVGDNSPSVIRKIKTISKFMEHEENSEGNESDEKTKSETNTNFSKYNSPTVTDKEAPSLKLNKRLLSSSTKISNNRTAIEDKKKSINFYRQNSYIDNIKYKTKLEPKTNAKIEEDNPSVVTEKEEATSKLQRRSLANDPEVPNKINTADNKMSTITENGQGIQEGDTEYNTKTEYKYITKLVNDKSPSLIVKNKSKSKYNKRSTVMSSRNQNRSLVGGGDDSSTYNVEHGDKTLSKTKLMKENSLAVNKKEGLESKLKKRSLTSSQKFLNKNAVTENQKMFVTFDRQDSSGDGTEYETKTESRTSTKITEGNSPSKVEKSLMSKLYKRSLASSQNLNKKAVTEDHNSLVTVNGQGSDVDNMAYKTKTESGTSTKLAGGNAPVVSEKKELKKRSSYILSKTQNHAGNFHANIEHDETLKSNSTSSTVIKTMLPTTNHQSSYSKGSVINFYQSPVVKEVNDNYKYVNIDHGSTSSELNLENYGNQA